MVKKYHNMGDETQSVAEIAVQCGRGQGKYKCGRGANRNCWCGADTNFLSAKSLVHITNKMSLHQHLEPGP